LVGMVYIGIDRSHQREITSLSMIYLPAHRV
jgi:hypothetical protein